MRVAVLMPAFEEGERLAETLDDLAKHRGDATITVFVVDDGGRIPVSADDLANRARVTTPDRDLRVVLARHAVNLGQGASLETARRLALDPKWASPGFDAFVTMDAD